MPAFTFEKISAPVRRKAINPTAKKQRGVIGQVIDRLVGTRAKRIPRAERSARREEKSGA